MTVRADNVLDSAVHEKTLGQGYLVIIADEPKRLRK